MPARHASHNFDAARRMLPFVGKRPLPVSSEMTSLRPTSKTAGLAAAFSLVLLAGSALAQEERGSGNFLDNLFSRGEPPAQSRQSAQPAPSGRVAQSDPGDISVRLDRMENALRQLTGTIEQLQYRNQQLEMQIQQLGARGGGVLQPQAAPAGPGNAPPPVPNPAGAPMFSIRRKIRVRQVCRERWAIRRSSPRPNGSRTTRHRSVPRADAQLVRRSICRRWPKTVRSRRSRRPCRPGRSLQPAARRCRYHRRMPSTDAAAASPQCGAGSCRRAACNLAAVGLAAGRIRHGVRLRAA